MTPEPQRGAGETACCAIADRDIGSGPIIQAVLSLARVESVELRNQLSSSAAVIVGLPCAQRSSNGASLDFFNTPTFVWLQYQF